MKVQSIFPSDSESILWLIAVGQVKLGIDATCGWCLQLGSRVVMLKTRDDMVPLLPLLEMGRAQFFAHIVNVMKQHPKYIVFVFPEVFLLQCAFETSVSDYWPNKAIDWLDADSSILEELRESLLSLMHQRWVGQRLKQRIVRKLK